MTEGWALAARIWLPDDAAAAVHVRVESMPRRGDHGRFHIVTLGQMTCDATTFLVENEMPVGEDEDGGERDVFAKTRRHEAPRDFV